MLPNEEKILLIKNKIFLFFSSGDFLFHINFSVFLSFDRVHSLLKFQKEFSRRRVSVCEAGL